MYSVTLYCSDSACDAVLEAQGSLEAVAAALCPFCGCMLAEISCMPCGEEAQGDGVFEDLELWVVHAPVVRRLRRRRRSGRRLPKAA
jgi:hypothetical protein